MPDRLHQHHSEYVAPKSEIEVGLVSIIGQLLRLEQVSTLDNFFNLGGHSLLAVQLISRIRIELFVEVSLRWLFEEPTIAALANRIELARSKKQDAITPLVALRQDGPQQLSYAQERMWFIDQLEGASSLYNVPLWLRLKGQLNADALTLALQRIVDRHTVLRTKLKSTGDGPRQEISDEVLKLSHVSLTGTEGDIESSLLSLMQDEGSKPFDLSSGLKIRATLVDLNHGLHEPDSALLITLHHVATDGWSRDVLRRELCAFYNGYCHGNNVALPALPIQYADYADWQRRWLDGRRMANQVDYWKKQLSGAPELLVLPTDYPRPAVQRFKGDAFEVLLSKRLTKKLRALSWECDTTLFASLLSAFQVLLSRYTQQMDIVVGSPIANRTRVETESLIGFFVNTLVLRSDLSGEISFKELLAQVRETTLSAYEHQDVPFEKLVEELQPTRSLSYSPLVQVMFVLQNTPSETLSLDGLEVERLDQRTEGGRGSAKFDLTLSMTEIDDGLKGVFNYNADLFERSTIERMAGHLGVLLDGIVADPELPVSRLPLLTEAEQHQQSVVWNDTARAYPNDQSIQSLFEAQVERTPDAIAVSFGGDQLSYAALNVRANQLAHHLREKGVVAETQVGICVERSLEMIVGLLAILKAGGAYVPVDASYPEERQRLMFESVTLVLAQRSLAAQVCTVVTEDTTPVLCLDDQSTAWSEGALSNPGPLPEAANGDSLAYVMYTSGTTGVPKGIHIEHRGVVRLVKNADYMTLDAEQVLLQLAPLSFDASTLEIWGALLNGGRLVVMPAGEVSLASVGQIVREEAVTTLFMTSGLFHVMVEERLDDLRDLRQLLSGGDVLSVVHVERAYSELTDTRLICCYGPTENTTFSTSYTVSSESDLSRGVPIGRPIGNSQAYVLDGHLSLVPVGVTGELYLGGDGLARGYVNDAVLTGERFIEHPEGLGRLYRTGDYARYRADGEIEFQGRRDTQVKHNGYRIELGEIESQVSTHGQVTGAVSVLAGEEEGRYLALYYTSEEALDSRELQGYLSERLPTYMVPSVYMSMERLPLTANGKVDRAALPSPDRGEQSEVYEAPSTETERALSLIWSELLGVERVGVHDNFFELGGHSLKAIQLISRIRSELSVEVSLRGLFENTTVRELSSQIDRARLANPSRSKTEVTADREGDNREEMLI